MNVKDNLTNFRRFALTNSTSVYGEDSKTAQELLIQSARKVAECMDKIIHYGELIEALGLEFEDEELQLNIETMYKEIKNQVNATYSCIYDENSESAIELAGNAAKMANECVKTVNMFDDYMYALKDKLNLEYDAASETLILKLGGED